MSDKSIVLAAALTASSLGLGCNDTQSATAPPTAAAEVNASAGTASGRVSKIVFVGQKEACPCTRERIDKTWSTLEGVLAEGPRLPVEKIQLDVDEQRYDDLDDLETVMVAPGIYFFDANGGLVDMRQGEVEADALSALLR